MSRGSNRGPETTRRPSCSKSVSASSVGTSPAGHPVDLDAGETALAVGRWQPAEGPGVSSGEEDPLRGHPLVGYGVLHLEGRSGKPLRKLPRNSTHASLSSAGSCMLSGACAV